MHSILVWLLFVFLGRVRLLSWDSLVDLVDLVHVIVIVIAMQDPLPLFDHIGQGGLL